MAVDRHQVDDVRLAAGRRILEMTDAVGFGAYAAGWVHDRPTDTWRYLLSTPMLKSKGPTWVYERLLRVFKHMPLPEGVSPLDIFVIDPALEMALFGNFLMGGRMHTLDGKLISDSFMIAQDMRFEGFSVTDGFVSFYRRLATGDRKRQRDPVRTFNHRVDMLEAA